MQKVLAARLRAGDIRTEHANRMRHLYAKLITHI
jgi:hypothetical protein